MKLLLLFNMMPDAVVKAMGQGSNGSGLWVDHVLSKLALRPDISVQILCRGAAWAEGRVNDRMEYCVFPEPAPHRYYGELENRFRRIVKGFCPDVVHIWGTEYGHTLAMVNACQREGFLERVVISIQGLCSYVEAHHNEGIPQRVIHACSFRDLIRRDNLAREARMYTTRGRLEIQALKKVRHVIGRTDWDRACTDQINPKAQYHFCNETMRDGFYVGAWKYEDCVPHRIFAPGWTDPSKGFHYLLEAVSLLQRDYPDVSIYVPGDSYYPTGLKGRLRMRAHHKYLIRLTEQYGLRDRIHFLGYLSAEEMKENFLKANVYVLPSMVENSPNTVCEAMLLGTPCVSANVGGLMKMLLHGKEGYLYQSTAPYMLAYYVKQVFGQKEAAEQLGRAAAEHARKTHDPDENMKALLAIYETVRKEA